MVNLHLIYLHKKLWRNEKNMHVTLIHFLSIIYMFLEQYVYIRGIDQWYYKDVEFSQKVNQLQVDCRMEQEISSLAPDKQPIFEKPVIETTLAVLDETAEGLWKDINQELQQEEEENYDKLYDGLKGSLDRYYQEQDEDYLYISDANHVEYIEMDASYTGFATAKINDNLFGQQQWTVQVIGSEMGYIHVSDGSGRIWLEIGVEKAGKIRNGNILVIDVNREDDKVHVERILRIEDNSIEDYAIPDEDSSYIYEQLAI